MGRELRRVPMDFDYPLNKVWEGYLNPHYKKCPHCTGNGETAAYKRLDGIVRLLMLSEPDSIRGKNHPYFDSINQFIGGFDGLPSPDMAELTVGLAGRDLSFVHDGSDGWAARRKIIEAAGLDPERWGICTFCQGKGIDPAVEEIYNSWIETPPPKGDGFQLWETTSEGSPKSPVFSTLEELCVWCETNATTFGNSRASALQWKQMLDSGFVAHQEGNVLFM